MSPANLARMTVGAACLADPRGLLRVVGGPDRDEVSVALVTRALGARLVAQGVVGVLVGAPLRRPGMLVELTHAVSMLGVAACWPRHRRTALVSAAAATSLVVLDLRDR
jgi:hypothetical protein